ncbi:MAG TPA: hypothetical protein VJK71_00640 [Gemmatimonadales bacterium]|nr:hypothetical protein [Gemmatimonadales bacterium]
MIITLFAGLVLGAIASGIAWRVWGEQAAVGAAVFAALATGIQIGALVLMGPVRNAGLSRYMARWGAGMGLRLLGILALALAVALDPRHFPPLPVALGFLGVLLPLLVLEVKLLR